MNSQGINDEQIVRLTSSTINLQPVESSSNDTRSSNKSELDTDNKCEKCLYASSTTHCPICGYVNPLLPTRDEDQNSFNMGLELNSSGEHHFGTSLHENQGTQSYFTKMIGLPIVERVSHALQPKFQTKADLTLKISSTSKTISRSSHQNGCEASMESFPSGSSEIIFSDDDDDQFLQEQGIYQLHHEHSLLNCTTTIEGDSAVVHETAKFPPLLLGREERTADENDQKITAISP
jgi:hypothetical protein